MSKSKSGLFPACFQVSRDNFGGETLNLKWLVNPMQRTISGTGQVTQPINPPTDITVQMTGHYVEKSTGEVLVVAAGSMPGASIQVVLKLDSWGGDGEALSVRWLANNHYFSDQDVPAKSVQCFG